MNFARFVCRTAFVLVTFATFASVRAARRPNLLRADPDPRKSQKSTVCQLGKNRYELESVWHPDLGPPFGVMACIVCQCVPVQRKRRIKAKTKCRNIQDECPKPNCPNPVLLPGQCCKLCPGQSIFGNGVQASSAQLDRDEENDKANKNMFAALLTSRFVPDSDESPSLAVATGRFRFRKKSLHFSFMSANVGDMAATALRFVNQKGQILEELLLRLNDRQRKENVVCGIWRKVPRSYRRLIKEDKMVCVLVFSPNNQTTTASNSSTVKLGGRMQRQSGLDTELLSGILHPTADGNTAAGNSKHLFGAGGTAVVSVDSQTGGLHVNTIFTGVMPTTAKYNIPLKLTLTNANAARDGKEDGPILEHDFVVDKTSLELNSVVVRSALKASALRQLARAKLVLEITNQDDPSFKIGGRVSPKDFCGVFCTVLGSTAPAPIPGVKPVTGYGLFDLNKDGSLDYRIRLYNVVDQVTSLTIARENKENKKRPRVIEDVAASYANGWANGTVTKINIDDLDSLSGRDVFVEVETAKAGLTARGRVNVEMFNEAHVTGQPLLMGTRWGVENTAPEDFGHETSLVGLAWLGADEDCVLHVDVQVAGFDEAYPSSVELWHRPGKFAFEPSKTYEISKLDAGGRFEGESAPDVPNDVLAQIGWGLANLVVMQHRFGSNNANVSAWADPMKVDMPENCLPKGTKVTNALLSGAVQANGRPSSLELLKDESNNEVDDDFRCLYEGKVYMEGEQWPATHSKCEMCHCSRGRVNCEPEVCPVLTCSHPHPPSEENCCPTCPQDARSGKATNRGCAIPGDPVFHPAGSTWHPYVPPNGFDKCVSCTCLGSSLSVDCKRNSCPPLTCDSKLAFKEKVTDCCKRCPDPKTMTTEAPNPSHRAEKDTGHDQSVDEDKMSDSEYRGYVLRNGGCEYQGGIHKNGAEWLLNLRPWGEMKCYPCTCKDGTARCKRKTCPKLECKDTVMVPEIDPCCRRCRSDVEQSALASSSNKLVAARHSASASGASSTAGGEMMQSDEPYRSSSSGKHLVRDAKLRHRPSSLFSSASSDETSSMKGKGSVR